MTDHAQQDASADLESGSPPYSRSDSPSPEDPLIDHRNNHRGSQRRPAGRPTHAHARDPRRYSDDIERLDGGSRGSHYRSSRSTTTTSLGIPKKVGTAVSRWIRGPDPPEIQRINPIFPHIQAIPIRILDNYCRTKRSKAFAWLVACALWLMSFILVEHFSYFRGEETILQCNDNLWAKNSGCGLDGIDCRSFANASFVFRCPTDCGSARVLEPYTIGDQQFNYQGLLIGGGLPSPGVDSRTRHYRADSFICLAAAHSGVLQADKGGCARLRKTGMQASFPSSSSGGFESIPFDAPFVSSFTIEDSESCTDLRWTAFGITLAFSIVISLFTTNPTVFYWSLFCSIFWEVGMAGDPPRHRTAYDLVAIAATRFLPTAFAGYVIERFVVRRTLVGLNAQIEKTVLWVGACWIGALNNYTFDVWVPISRLTPHDLGQQPGAKAALAIIVVALVVIAVFQVLAIRKEGNMARYLQFYLLCAVCIGLLIAIPNLNLRIHHYILSLLLLPGTRVQTRPSLVYQGLLMGLFINGLARWGWDGILQTSFELRGDALLGSMLPKLEDVVVAAANVTVFWALPKTPYDSVSVLVNDVERYRGVGGSATFERRTIGQVLQQAWYDSPMRGVNTTAVNGGDEPAEMFGIEEREKLYIRVGYVSGSSVWDYTKAVTVFANGTWVAMEAGAS